VEIRSAAGCRVPRSANQQVIILGMKETNSALRIFPNPTHDYLQVDFDMKAYPGLELQVLDLQGRIWWEQKSVQSNDLINLRQLPTGTYIVKPSHGLPAIKVLKQ
jgi:hypothetical protein